MLSEAITQWTWFWCCLAINKVLLFSVCSSSPNSMSFHISKTKFEFGYSVGLSFYLIWLSEGHNCSKVWLPVVAIFRYFWMPGILMLLFIWYLSFFVTTGGTYRTECLQFHSCRRSQSFHQLLNTKLLQLWVLRIQKTIS